MATPDLSRFRSDLGSAHTGRTTHASAHERKSLFIRGFVVVGRRTLQVFSCRLVFAENAAPAVLVMKFRAGDGTLKSPMERRRSEHPQRRGDEINPERIPEPR